MEARKDRSLYLIIIGGLLLIVGAIAAFYGPIEMYCFYLFSEGGRFHYEGFGFGSFMFGNIAVQIIGYYLVAIVCIPLGYGHVKRRRWARPLALALLWFWLVQGVPLLIVFSFVLFTAKSLSVIGALITLVFLGLSYMAIPGLLIWFYRSQSVQLTFEAQDPTSYWIEELPMPVLVLGSLFLFYTVALHIPIFFKGIFPFFGVFLLNLEGFFLLDISILCLVCLTWGTLKLKPWAWWGSLVYFGLMSVSWILTLAKSSLSGILALMSFPPTEMEALQGMPVQGFHLAAFIGVPFLVTLGLIIFSRRHFRTIC